jgi:uncharacterized protein
MENPIHNLIFEGNVRAVEKAILADPQLVHDRDDLRNTPLHTACWAKQIGILGTLLAFKPDVNAIGAYGRTPLHYAVHEGETISVPIVSVLLANGANPSIRDDNGFTPADWAKIEMHDGLQDVLSQLEPENRKRSR